MPEPPFPTHTAPPHSPDGRWVWDGWRWTPITGADGHRVVTPPVWGSPSAEPVRPGSRRIVAGVACGLGVGAVVIGLVVWALTLGQFIAPARAVVVLFLLVLAFAAGALAVTFGVGSRSRPRPGLAIAGFVCGLVGQGMLVVWVLLLWAHAAALY